VKKTGITDLEDYLELLRSNGWSVAVHNDYSLDGDRWTFWLFTHFTGRFVKSEAKTDIAAVSDCWTQVQGPKKPNIR